MYIDQKYFDSWIEEKKKHVSLKIVTCWIAI